MSQDFKLDSIEEAIEDSRTGRFVIVADDEDRENEDDFIMATELITPGKVNFMVRCGRGVLCAPIAEGRAAQLGLNMQVHEDALLHETPFTVTVDLTDRGCTTSVPMYDHAMAIRALADPNTKPTDLARPDHVSPLRARNRGVLHRAGHTETAIDLARLAGLQPVGALIEIINENGTMARLPQLVEIAKQWNMKIISIRNLIAYRLKTDCTVEEGVRAELPTEWGMFDIIPFRQKNNGLEHIALIKGDISTNKPALIRMRNSYATGDIFGSLRCECGEQLRKATEIIEQESTGVVVHLNQEGRGIGSMGKIKTYKLQDEELNTVDANLHLGHKVDERDCGVGAQILRAIDVTEMRPITSNPIKRVGLEACGLKAAETVPLEIKPNQYNTHYLHAKKMHMGHDLHNVK